MSNVTRIQFRGITIEEGGVYDAIEGEGLSGMDIRSAEMSVTGRHGGIIQTQRYGPRNIAFEVQIDAETYEEFFTALDELNRAFSISPSKYGDLLAVRMWNNVERFIMVKVVTMAMPTFREGETTSTNVRVELRAEWPFFLDSSTASIIATTIPATFGGTPVPSPVASPLSGAISSGIVTIINDGDIAWYPTIKFKGGVLNPTAKNLSSGKQLTVLQSIAAGETITISFDPYDGSQAKKGSQDIFEYLVGDLFELEIGSNPILFTAGSSDASALMEVTFTPYFISSSN